MLTVLVAVGTTRFDDLVKVVLSAEVLKQLGRAGYTRIILQHGVSPLPTKNVWTRHGMCLDAFTYSPELGKHIGNADLVISHAGSGMILDTLRGPLTEHESHKRPGLLVVTNDALMHGHQYELAHALSKSGHLSITNIANFINDLSIYLQRQQKLLFIALPEPQTERFFEALDHLIGQ